MLSPGTSGRPAPGAPGCHRLVLPFSARTRVANLARMAEERSGVLAIGGITGAALDAAAYRKTARQKDYAGGDARELLQRLDYAL